MNVQTVGRGVVAGYSDSDSNDSSVTTTTSSSSEEDSSSKVLPLALPVSDDEDDGLEDISLSSSSSSASSFYTSTTERSTMETLNNDEELGLQQSPPPLFTQNPNFSQVVDQVLSGYRRAITDHTTTPPPVTLEELALEIRSQQQQQQPAMECAPDQQQQQQNEQKQLQLRIHHFRQARALRRHRYSRPQPWGIISLYDHLAQVRLDLEWAQDAVYRHQNGLPYLSWTDFDRIHCKELQARRTCWCTYTIVVVSTVLLLVSFALNNWELAPLKINPMLGPTPEVLIQLGAVSKTHILQQDEWYRLVTAVFLHAGVIHYVINMVAIWLLGRALETVHGSWATAWTFGLSGVGGFIASALFNPTNQISVGASGGIYGMVGVCLADCWNNWDVLMLDRQSFPAVAAFVALGVDICVDLSIGLTAYVDNFSHVGGFIYGLCLGIPLLEKLSQTGFFGKVSFQRRLSAACTKLCAAAIALTLLIATFTLLYTSDPKDPVDICPACRYISCVPFPFWKENKWWDCKILDN